MSATVGAAPRAAETPRGRNVRRPPAGGRRSSRGSDDRRADAELRSAGWLSTRPQPTGAAGGSPSSTRRSRSRRSRRRWGSRGAAPRSATTPRAFDWADGRARRARVAAARGLAPLAARRVRADDRGERACSSGSARRPARRSGRRSRSSCSRRAATTRTRGRAARPRSSPGLFVVHVGAARRGPERGAGRAAALRRARLDDRLVRGRPHAHAPRAARRGRGAASRASGGSRPSRSAPGSPATCTTRPATRST